MIIPHPLFLFTDTTFSFEQYTISQFFSFKERDTGSFQNIFANVLLLISVFLHKFPFLCPIQLELSIY